MSQFSLCITSKKLEIQSFFEPFFLLGFCSKHLETFYKHGSVKTKRPLNSSFKHVWQKVSLLPYTLVFNMLCILFIWFFYEVHSTFVKIVGIERGHLNWGEILHFLSNLGAVNEFSECINIECSVASLSLENCLNGVLHMTSNIMIDRRRR